MKSGYYTDIEAAKLGSLLAQRHIHAGYFGQMLVSRSAGHLSPYLAAWHNLKCGESWYDYPSG